MHNEAVHHAIGLKRRRVGIGMVARIEAKVVDLKPVQHGVTGFDNLFAREPHFV